MPVNFVEVSAKQRRFRLGPATVSAALLALLPLAALSPLAAQGRDVTPLIEQLGNPAKLTYPADDMTFARNVWDLKAFAGRL